MAAQGDAVEVTCSVENLQVGPCKYESVPEWKKDG